MCKREREREREREVERMGHRGRERLGGGGEEGGVVDGERKRGRRRRRNEYNVLADQSNAQSFVDNHMGLVQDGNNM